MQKKKLQVFVSSTYTDLREERQAAVEAILSAGHIPAGMELFAAGDKKQWEIIKTWIEESDVYMLILGGRYGSIESESGKSYTHLEYEYALEIGKPLFAVIGSHFQVQHDDNPTLKAFKNLVTSKMVRFWEDKKDIKLAVHETLGEFSKRENLVGWIPGNKGFNSPEVAEELAKLSKENADLRERISQYEKDKGGKIAGFGFDELFDKLNSEQFAYKLQPDEKRLLTQLGIDFNTTEETTLLEYLYAIGSLINGSSSVNWMYAKPLDSLSLYGIISIQWIQINKSITRKVCSFTDEGRSFYFYLKTRMKRSV